MDLLSDALLQAFGIVVRVGVGVLVWIAAVHFATEYEPVAKAHPVLAYGRVAFACAVLALIAWAGYGTHVEDADPIFGGGEVVQDFETTPAERNRHGLTIFLATFVIAAHGTWRGRNLLNPPIARPMTEDERNRMLMRLTLPRWRRVLGWVAIAVPGLSFWVLLYAALRYGGGSGWVILSACLLSIVLLALGGVLSEWFWKPYRKAQAEAEKSRERA